MKQIRIIAIFLSVFLVIIFLVFVANFAGKKQNDNKTKVLVKGKETIVMSKGKSSIDLKKCDLWKYNLDCEITKFLEENLAWITRENSVNFCSYKVLGQNKNDIYLLAGCGEYYLKNKERICETDGDYERCTKFEEECKKCETKEIPEKLVDGSGIYTPLKLTKTSDSFSMWLPRDGAYYQKDIYKEFPKEIAKKAFEYNGGFFDIIDRAEEYFQKKMSFKTAEIFEDKKCQLSMDCSSSLIGKYGLLSTCPHTMKCVDNKCAVGCYDLSD